MSAKENDHDDGNEESHQSVQKPQTQQQHEQLDRQPNPVFEEYAKLPLGLRYCIPNDLIGTPIEDVDTFYDVNKVSVTHSSFLIHIALHTKCVNSCDARMFAGQLCRV